MFSTAAVENGMADLQNLKHRIKVGSSNSTSRYIPKSFESRDVNIYFYTCIQQLHDHNSQEVEAAQCPSTDKWTKEMYIHRGILSGLNN